jgi:hypothetical protein
VRPSELGVKQHYKQLFAKEKEKTKNTDGAVVVIAAAIFILVFMVFKNK